MPELPRIAAVRGCAGYWVSETGIVVQERRVSGSEFTELVPLATRIVYGYPYVKVRWSDGRKRDGAVHRLVAEAFHGPQPDGMECRHLDGNRMNPSAGNLRWGTALENAADRWRHGTALRPNQRKLTDDDMSEIRKRIAAGDIQARIAEDFGITASCVSQIKRGVERRYNG